MRLGWYERMSGGAAPDKFLSSVLARLWGCKVRNFRDPVLTRVQGTSEAVKGWKGGGGSGTGMMGCCARNLISVIQRRQRHSVVRATRSWRSCRSTNVSSKVMSAAAEDDSKPQPAPATKPIADGHCSPAKTGTLFLSEIKCVRNFESEAVDFPASACLCVMANR